MTAIDAKKSLADAYYEKLAKHSVTALWTIPDTEFPEPAIEEAAHVWRWTELYELLLEAADVVELGQDAARRALTARNPKRQFGATHTMGCGYQMVMPGETAPAHRHTIGAIRFVLQGGGYTTVEGEPILMADKDLVLTPAGTWHDHRNTGDQPLVWLDGLDVPFVRGMRAQFFEEYPGNALQELHLPEGHCLDRYPAGLKPFDEKPSTPHSPMTVYRWVDTLAALERMRDSGIVDAHEGTKMEYINPLTGGHVLPTLACYMQLLTAGVSTEPRRTTSSAVLCVAQGSGHSIIDGKRLDWDEKDFLVVPSWAWAEHHADGDVAIFSMTDEPMLEPFNLLREERA
ncbi:cupin domain-containing protein [Nocardia sp. NPDC052278]|uniref:cupin domain-containing protein n=1 Tax=unclassified Nocardia TaxID=2637762 RepID=UPI0036A800B4